MVRGSGKVEYERLYFAGYPYNPYREDGRLERVARKLTTLIKGKRILDVGCAYGHIAGYLNKWGYDAYGCDISTWCGEQSKALISGRYIQCHAAFLPFKDKSFDVLFTESTLEHIDEKYSVQILNEFHRVSDLKIIHVSFRDDYGHITVKSYDWWREKMPPNTYFSQTGKSVDIEDHWEYIA